LLSSVPTVEGISSIVPIYHGIGGDPLEMGILRPWAKTKMGPEKLLEVPPIMHSFTRSKGIARPLEPDSLRKQLMLSKLIRVAMLAISFHKILCYYFPGNTTCLTVCCMILRLPLQSHCSEYTESARLLSRAIHTLSL